MNIYKIVNEFIRDPGVKLPFIVIYYNRDSRNSRESRDNRESMESRKNREGQKNFKNKEGRANREGKANNYYY